MLVDVLLASPQAVLHAPPLRKADEAKQLGPCFLHGSGYTIGILAG